MPTRKTGYGSATAPPPPAKATKTNVPSKTTSSKPAPPMTVPARSPTSQATTAPILRAKEYLNPPPFTYAPEIAVPARKSDQHVVKWLWKAGRAYLTFYKTGISHVRQTSQLAKTLREKAAKTPDKDTSEILTRAEWQIVRRSRKDALRLPAFGVLVLLLGEWLPLVVLYITPLIPEACRIPQQVQRSITKLEDKRQDRLRRVSLDAMRLMSKDRRPVGAMNMDMPSFQNDAKPVPWSEMKNMQWKDMTLFELMLFAAQHDCYPRVFDWLHATPPKWLLQRNVRKTLAYLKRDDELVERDGGWSALGKEEVERACVERGIAVVGKREDELRKALAVQVRGGKF
ncbi:hypothetical protein EJ02DRAFT_450416 [Clathrospora elynae]|uniref:Letm1 RBD domain-containing protein n=1 Tax=Clathrospora elynae TaxID=706981 RepID=A0A6A5T3D3_9PLEO|nr:hypothetical protein EJ02DRAFT_450416 [Clathrospora elynae]